MDKNCTTCFNHYHNKHTNSICNMALRCDGHSLWEPYTNADWIKTANIAELSEFLCNVGDICPACIAKEYCSVGDNGFTNWLKERKVDEDESK